MLLDDAAARTAVCGVGVGGGGGVTLWGRGGGVVKSAGVVVCAREGLREEAASVLARVSQWMTAGRGGAAGGERDARGVRGAEAEGGGEGTLVRNSCNRELQQMQQNVAREDAASVLARVEAMCLAETEECKEKRCAHAHSANTHTHTADTSSAGGRRERSDERHAECREGVCERWAWERTVDNCCAWERALVVRHMPSAFSAPDIDGYSQMGLLS